MGITQDEAAKMTYISRQTIVAWCRRSTLTDEILIKLRDAGIDLNHLADKSLLEKPLSLPELQKKVEYLEEDNRFVKTVLHRVSKQLDEILTKL
jgi:hypothetical protein